MNEYYLYLVVKTEEYEIHRVDCEFACESVKTGYLQKKNWLGYANSKEETYKKFRNVFPLRAINLPNCCD